MSLKSIEMQVALPRTIDAAKLQDQLLQQGQLINDQANMKMQKEEIKKRMTVVKEEQKDNAKFQNHGDPNESFQNAEKEKKKPVQKSKEKHPYKGNFLDFSG